MTVADHPPIVPHTSRNLVERAKNILIHTPREWEVIDAEPATTGGLYLGYLVYIAAIGPVCRFVGNIVFNHTPVFGALASGLIGYIVELFLVYGLALLIDVLAPRFGGRRDRVQAMKVSAYSFTAAAVAGVFAIFPPLSPLAVVGIYGLMVMWLGLPRLMRVPKEKALTYFAVVLVAMLVCGVVLAIVTAPLSSIGRI